MATGDTADITARIRQLLPGWFADSSPTADALLVGAATALAFIYSLYVYAIAQTRILTATGIWLDLVAQDFYGTSLQRAANQSDDSFRAVITSGLFRPKATRAAISDTVLALTGNLPAITEPFSPADCGAYSVGYASYGGGGGYGSMLLPAQVFVTAYRPPQPGIASVAGYAISTAGYGVASQAEYASLSLILGNVTDADIYAAISSACAAGVEIWTYITNLQTPEALTLDGGSFTIDGADLAFLSAGVSATTVTAIIPLVTTAPVDNSPPSFTGTLGNTLTMVPASFTGATSQVNDWLVNGVPVEGATLNSATYISSTITPRSIGTDTIGSTTALGATVSSPPSTKVPVGVNIDPLTWYRGARSLNNLAGYFAWNSPSSGQLCNPAHITPAGELLALPAGTSAYIILGPVVTAGNNRRRWEWTGNGNTGSIYTRNSTSTIDTSLNTSGTDTTVTPNVHWLEWTENVPSLIPGPTGGGNATIQFTVVNPADPPRNVFVSEVNGTTANNGTRAPYFYDQSHYWHPTYVALLEPFTALRWMDVSDVNNIYNPTLVATSANRARSTAAFPPNRGTSFAGGIEDGFGGSYGAAALCSDGTTNRLTIWASTGTSQANTLAFWQVRKTAGATPAAWTALGAGGNEATIIIAAASATPSITVDPVGLTVTITPSTSSVTVTGANNLSNIIINGSKTTISSGTYAGNSLIGIINQMTAFLTANPNTLAGMIIPGFTASRCAITTATTPPGQETIVPGTYPFAGGFNPQTFGTIPIEQQIALCNMVGAHYRPNIPYIADDTYLIDFAQTVAANLNPGLLCIVEIQNEPWNQGFPATSYLSLLSQLENTYDMSAFENYEPANSCLQVLSYIDNAKTVMAPYFASRPLGFSMTYNAQPGSVNTTNPESVVMVARTNPQAAVAFARSVDFIQTAPYVSFGLSNFAAGAVVTVGQAVIYSNKIYFSLNAHTTTSSTPDVDTANWILAINAPQTVLQQMKVATDTTMAGLASDYATATTTFGKQYMSYELGYGFSGVNDLALLTYLDNGAESYKIMNYMIARFFAVTGQAPYAFYSHYGLVGGISTNLWMIKQANAEVSPRYQAVIDIAAGTPHPYFMDDAVPTILGGAYVGQTLSATLGTAWAYTVPIAGGTGAITFALSSTGTIPAGVTANATTGQISVASAVAAGTISGLSLTATDSLGNTDVFGPFSIIVS